MFQNRDEIRQVYITVWQKLQQKKILEPMESIIAEVIQLHPEYHTLLEQQENVKHKDFNPDSGQTNPFLHMGMHIALHEQTSTDRPPGIGEIQQKLCQRIGQHEAEHAMMECLGEALWIAQRNNSMPDDSSYLDCLKKL